ncbi:MAG TPA: VTT domain-containing protein [Methanobacterium sp.]
MNLSPILNYAESFIVTNASWAVFLGCIIEQIIVPIPASLIVLSATFLVMQGADFSLVSVGTLIIRIVIPASLGITLGSFFYYILAYKLGKPFIEKTSRFLGVTVEDVVNVERQFKESRYDDIFMFLARCFPVIPSIAINLFCGLIRYDLKKYVITTFLGSAVQISGWGIIAWLFGNAYQTLEGSVSLLGNFVLVITVLAVVGFIVIKKRGKIKENKK